MGNISFIENTQTTYLHWDCRQTDYCNKQKRVTAEKTALTKNWNQTSVIGEHKTCNDYVQIA